MFCLQVEGWRSITARMVIQQSVCVFLDRIILHRGIKRYLKLDGQNKSSNISFKVQMGWANLVSLKTRYF